MLFINLCDYVTITVYYIHELPYLTFYYLELTMDYKEAMNRLSVMGTNDYKLVLDDDGFRVVPKKSEQEPIKSAAKLTKTLPKEDKDVLVEIECKHCGTPLNLVVCKRSKAIDFYKAKGPREETSNFSDEECRYMGIDPEKYRWVVYNVFRTCAACREI